MSFKIDCLLTELLVTYLRVARKRIFNGRRASRFRTGMPQIIDLRSRSELLKGVSLIVDERLCNNINIIGKKQATIVDTGARVF